MNYVYGGVFSRGGFRGKGKIGPFLSVIVSIDVANLMKGFVLRSNDYFFLLISFEKIVSKPITMSS